MPSSAEETYADLEERVLMLLPKSRDAESMPRVLERMHVAYVMCATPEELCAEIGKGAGALLLKEETLSPHMKECLAGALNGQPPWSELPIIVLLRPGPENKAGRDARLLPGDVTLVERPVRVNTLVSIIRSALRDRRRQYLVRDQLQALDEAKDELEVRVRERTEELTSALQKLRGETEERLRGVEELRAKEQLLIQQSRMAAMGEMIGFIGHQWRQPLNTLALIVQEASMRYKMGDFDEKYLDACTARAMWVIEQMSRTIDDFSNFFKADKQKVSFVVKEILTNTIQLIEASFRHYQVAIEIFSQDDMVVEGFPNEYAQVLLNILMNAKDALLERQVEQPRIVIRIFTEHNKAVTTIADNAGGIPEEMVGRIFDPYFTTKGPEKGTGVGLYMAKTIIEKNMGGRLSVRNVEGGAEFRIEV